MIEQNGQMLLFGETDEKMLYLTQDEIDRELGAGSGFSEGKERIKTQVLKREGLKADAAFLQKEYGIGGRSWSVGGRANLDYNTTGMTFTEWETGAKLHLSWVEVAKHIQRLVMTGKY